MHAKPSSFPPHPVSHMPNLKSPKKHMLCECDTESCAESEKCYCSLKAVKQNGIKMYDINLDSDTNTDNTMRSDLTRRGYATHSSQGSQQHQTHSSYSTGHSKSRSAGTIFSLHPDIIRQKSLSSNLSSDSENSDMNRSSRSSVASGYHSQEGTRAMYPRRRSASSEFLSDGVQVRRHPSGSVESSCSDDSTKSSHGSLKQNLSHRARSSSDAHAKILLVSAVDPSGKVVYRGASQKQTHEGSDTNSIMSMKKTAEIAALFSGLKLNQTTDLINQLQSGSESDDDAYSSIPAQSSILFSDNIENSLGYLP